MTARRADSDSVLSSLRVAALAALRQAVDAGATPADLARGDTMLRGADSLVTQGRRADAMVQLVTAASAWTDAERVARARVARDTVRPVVAAPTPPPPPPAPPGPPPALADPRVQIEKTIAAYARALESRDTGQVRRVYPGLSASQQRGWEDFFKAVRTLKADLRVTTVNVQGESADAVVDGVYVFDNATTGRVERRPVTFHASFVADPAGWRLNAIR